MAEIYKKPIYDTIHGFMDLTRTEDRIVGTPYFQRLRWIKQLGWSHYIYPGATHTRFAHVLGVMSVMHQIVRALGRGVDDSKLFNPAVHDAATMFHRKMRLAAMLHDIGTFPFSHSIEQGYINHYKEQINQGKRVPAANHEELGSHIVLHTDFEGGITRILKSDGFDPKEIAELIRGKSDNPLANQLIHSDIDADRIDYLIRDAHHTGVKYGVFDMEYLISNMRACRQKNGEVLAINESALTAVEYFLISRYTWYSQIINDGTGYKFDLLATKIAQYFIENKIVYTFEELKNLVSKNPGAFFGFNDGYFTAKMQEVLATSALRTVRSRPTMKTATVGAPVSLFPAISPMYSELIEMLMFRMPPKQIKVAPFQPSLVKTTAERQQLVENIHQAVEWLRAQVSNVPGAWVIEDIPTKDVIFTKNYEKGPRGDAQDSVRILDRDNKLKLLVDMPNSIVRVLSNYRNFIPRVYVSRSTYKYLQSKGLIKELEEKFGQVSAQINFRRSG